MKKTAWIIWTAALSVIIIMACLFAGCKDKEQEKVLTTEAPSLTEAPLLTAVPETKAPETEAPTQTPVYTKVPATDTPATAAPEIIPEEAFRSAFLKTFGDFPLEKVQKITKSALSDGSVELNCSIREDLGFDGTVYLGTANAVLIGNVIYMEREIDVSAWLNLLGLTFQSNALGGKTASISLTALGKIAEGIENGYVFDFPVPYTVNYSDAKALTSVSKGGIEGVLSYLLPLLTDYDKTIEEWFENSEEIEARYENVNHKDMVYMKLPLGEDSGELCFWIGVLSEKIESFSLNTGESEFFCEFTFDYNSADGEYELCGGCRLDGEPSLYFFDAKGIFSCDKESFSFYEESGNLNLKVNAEAEKPEKPKAKVKIRDAEDLADYFSGLNAECMGALWELYLELQYFFVING